MSLEVNGPTSELDNLLANDAITTFSDNSDTITKEDILLNHEFNQSYQPWNEIKTIKELNDSTIEIHVLETNKLITLFNIDTIGYQYRFTLTNSMISRIEMDTIPNSGYAYRMADSLYNLRLTELFDWISLIYPEKYEQIGEFNSESGKLILELAEEKGR
ncbi:MAG: hypothetical protein RIG77_18330 [Cyclobacteriaceae bacterium]